RVRAIMPDGNDIIGTAVGLGATGSLLIQGETDHEVLAADIVHLRQPELTAANSRRAMRSHYVTGEHLLVRTRAHPSVLIRPACNLVLWEMATGFFSGVLASYALPQFLRDFAA